MPKAAQGAAPQAAGREFEAEPWRYTLHTLPHHHHPHAHTRTHTHPSAHDAESSARTSATSTRRGIRRGAMALTLEQACGTCRGQREEAAKCRLLKKRAVTF